MQARSRPSWQRWAMRIAEVVADRSEDPYVQVGCIVARHTDGIVLSMGYNGLPPGVDKPLEWWRDRDGRRPFMVHAEMNALRFVSPQPGLILVSTHIPCSTCMAVIGSFQIGAVVYKDRLGEAHDHKLILRIAAMNGIHVTQIGD